MTKLKIITDYVNPPIPIRHFDWAAWIDGEEEAGPYGHGRTEKEALADLREAIEESTENPRLAELLTDERQIRLLEEYDAQA